MANVPGHFAHGTSAWRKLAGATWKAANDPTIYGMLSVDATAANEFLTKLSGSKHVTMTHLVTKAIADTLARHPECNGYIRRGRVYLRERIDVFVLVAIAPDGVSDGAADLTGVKIEDADRKTVIAIADEITAHVQDIRAGNDKSLASTKGLLSALPIWIARPALRFATFAQYELNWDLSPFGIPRDTFGAAFVTSVGTLGLGFAFPPIVPFTRLSVNVAAGAVQDQAVVDQGRIVAKPILPITATFDHRVIDGYQAAKLGQTFKRILEDPASHFDHER